MPKQVARHHVYVIELDPAVLQHAKFRTANPDHDPRKPALYVGMTGLDPETRFERHKYGVKDNAYVRRYGMRLRPDLYAGLNPEVSRARAAARSRVRRGSIEGPDPDGARCRPCRFAPTS